MWRRRSSVRQTCPHSRCRRHRSTMLGYRGPSWHTGTGHHDTLPTHQSQHSHTYTHIQPFNGLWSGTTRVGRYQKKHSPTHTHPDHRTSFIIFLHLQRSMASTLFILRADSLLVQPLSRSSLVFLLVLDPQLHTPVGGVA